MKNRFSGQTSRARRIQVVSAALFLVVATAGFAQSGFLSTESDIGAFESRFLDLFMTAQWEEAFALLRSPASALSEGEVDTLESTTTRQLNSLRSAYGPPVDHVLAERDEMAGVLIRRSYLLRYRNLPLRAWFVYYNNADSWRLTYFGWDDQFAEMF